MAFRSKNTVCKFISVGCEHEIQQLLYLFLTERTALLSHQQPKIIIEVSEHLKL